MSPTNSPGRFDLEPDGRRSSLTTGGTWESDNVRGVAIGYIQVKRTVRNKSSATPLICDATRPIQSSFLEIQKYIMWAFFSQCSRFP